MSAFEAALAACCPLAADVAAYEVDWTGRVHGTALAVALPRDAGEVAAVLAACAGAGAGVTVAGGRTGLVAGAVPERTVVLSTERLRGVEVDGATVLAGAGATLAEVQAAARGAGWEYGVDMASRGSATVGGTVATNAGGVHVVAHGTTRAQVLGAEAVLADGSVVSRLGGLAKDATGYDLTQLLVGSEGTLGVVTRARLRLVAPPGPQLVAWVPLPSASDAVALVQRLRLAGGVRAAELLLADGARLVAGVAGLTPLPDAPVLLLLEADVDVLTPALPDDAVVAADTADAARLWAYREGMTEAVQRASPPGGPHKLDVSLPLDRLGSFLAELPAATAPWTTHVFGHVGDGNLHVNVLGPAPDDEEVDDLVLRLAAAHGGSIGAEHGVGRLKRRWLHLSRSEAELAAQRAVKQALDPRGMLGPGVLLPDA